MKYPFQFTGFGDPIVEYLSVLRAVCPAIQNTLYLKMHLWFT